MYGQCGKLWPICCRDSRIMCDKFGAAVSEWNRCKVFMPIHPERAMANGEAPTRGPPTLSRHHSASESVMDICVCRLVPAVAIQQKKKKKIPKTKHNTSF